ncbi:hypothetical protein AAHB34_16005 [Paenarthrobacter ureafaciens]
MSSLRAVLEERANRGYGVITHTELREILAAHPVKRPIVRNAELIDGATVLDEVVAFEATVHLECMADNHWWLLVESGGVRVDVNLGTKRAKINAIAEES